MSVPSMRIEPWSGLSRPIRVLRNTDLPVPDGPSITEISPAGTVSETSPQISCLPNDLLRFSTLISTPMAYLSLLRHPRAPHPGSGAPDTPRSPLPGNNAIGAAKLRAGFLPRVTGGYTCAGVGGLDRLGNATRGGPPVRVDRPS